MAESIQNVATPQAVQPAQTTPLVAHLGSRSCWLVGSGRPKDPAKPNGDPSKAPCNERGFPVKAWHTRTDLLDTYDQTARKLRPPAVRFIGIRSSAAGDVAGYDLDDVLNAGMGCIDPVAWWVHEHYSTYTEITPSGAGLRMWWIVEGDAQPVSIKTATDRATGLSEVAFTAGVVDRTGTMQPQTFNIGRELYYRADRFLIVTGNPYAWLPSGQPDPLRTITAGDLARIAATVKAQRPPSAYVAEAENADATAGAVQIGATMTTTQDAAIIMPAAVPAQIIEAQPIAPAGAQDFHKEYAQAQLEQEAAAIAATHEGGRNNELNRAAYQLGGLVAHGVLSESEIERELSAAGEKAGLSKREVEATIKSGMDAGKGKPRQLPRPPQAQRAGQGRPATRNISDLAAQIRAGRAAREAVDNG